MDDNISWNNSNNTSEEKGKAHENYEANLRDAKVFVERVKLKLLNGMRCYITNHASKDILCLDITYTPPMTAKLGVYATSISLHQSSYIYSKEVEKYFNDYMRMDANFNAKDRIL